jgi:hypothetical protein
MNKNLIYQLVEMALSLASELDGADFKRTLLDIIQQGVQAYQEQSGKPLDPKLVGVLSLL